MCKIQSEQSILKSHQEKTGEGSDTLQTESRVGNTRSPLSKSKSQRCGHLQKQTNLTTQTRKAHKTPQAIMEVPKTPAQTRVLSVSYFDLIGLLIAPMRAESTTQFEETFHG